jgi:hypothetical protein
VGRCLERGLAPMRMLSGPPVFFLGSGTGGQERPRGTVLLGNRMREDFASVDDDVVTFALAVRTGDTEAEVDGFEGEGQFGEFSAALGVEFALAGRLGDGLWGDGLFSSGVRPDGAWARR